VQELPRFVAAQVWAEEIVTFDEDFHPRTLDEASRKLLAWRGWMNA
jgi:hypothetical protein